MIFDLDDRSCWAEIPFLLDQGPHRTSRPIRRPLQRELLRSFRVWLHETEPDPIDPLRLVEDKPDRRTSHQARILSFLEVLDESLLVFCSSV
jgi:hypothetical protein